MRDVGGGGVLQCYRRRGMEGGRGLGGGGRDVTVSRTGHVEEDV